MKNNNILKAISPLVIAFLFACLGQAQEYKVIVHKSNTVESLTKKQVSNLFLKRANWQTGAKALPVDLLPSSSVRATFTKEIHGRTIGAVRTYWQQAAFSGKGSAPIEKKNEEAVIEYVKSNPNAIGYVSNAADVSEVKVLTVN